MQQTSLWQRNFLLYTTDMFMHLKTRHTIFLRSILGIFLFFLLVLITILIAFHQYLPILGIAPKLLGMQGEKTYLILFQNNAELRPGGGFIGSYGLVSFNKGEMKPVTIHNVYDADGLLHKHFEPYFISRRYLQVHLYMRDSNFAVDFPKSAKKAAFMLQQETGQRVDGIVAIDVSFVRSLIAVVAPVYVWQYKDTVDENNFFLLTETQSDKHSFFGSTQKQDFLHASFTAIQLKVQAKKIIYYPKLLSKIIDAIQQKHLLFASIDPKMQSILTKARVSSTLWDPRQKKPRTINDFLGINEANIGANKANYFLKRSITHHATIEKSGKITGKVTIRYTNTTKDNAWPSGVYKNYLRIILPLHAQLLQITIDKQQQKIVPAVTNFREYESPTFQPPQGLEVDTAEEQGKTLYGFVISVGSTTTKTVTIMYKLANTINLADDSATYTLSVFKQPGMDNDPYAFTLTYPKGNTTKQSTFVTKLSTDKTIAIPL